MKLSLLGKLTLLVVVLLLVVSAAQVKASRTIEADLLIVGGGESAVAAAIQAARMGQQRIVLVNDIAWLGGEFSAEAVGAIDEWTVYKGKRTNFPRSGLFLEVLQKVRAYNLKKYGLANPGNAFCASETIEPAAAAQIFEELIAPYKAQIQIIRHYQPVQVESANNRIRSVTFEKTDKPQERLTVTAKLTIDASDWGDVIRLSGAGYMAGVDLHARFGEEDAPAGPLSAEARNEMNPISCPGLLQGAGRKAATTLPLVRQELALHLWAAIKAWPERFPNETDYLKPGHDADGDGTPDLDDPLPFDRDNDNLPDLLDPFPNRAMN